LKKEVHEKRSTVGGPRNASERGDRVTKTEPVSAAPKSKLMSAKGTSKERKNFKREHYKEIIIKKEKFTDSEDEEKKRNKKKKQKRNRVRNLRKTHLQKSLIVVIQKRKRRRKLGRKRRVVLEVVGSLYIYIT